jgi:hypothetical protein
VLASVLGVTMLDIVEAVRRREIDVAATQNIERLIEDFRFAWSS